MRTRGAAELRGMAAAIKTAEAMAPAHPHPGVESAAANVLAGTFASAADRAADVVRKSLGKHGWAPPRPFGAREKSRLFLTKAIDAP